MQMANPEGSRLRRLQDKLQVTLFSKDRSTVLWESERTKVGEQENISMVSACSELTRRAPIPDGRMERIMQPWVP